MAEEIKAEVIKRTQKTLGKYVKKPPLTEKLLRKPPFRFLHDIILVIIKETGFLENLFSEEELNSDPKDKEAKIAFLTKLINVVKLITGTELAIRPSKVIAGQEPTRTNELLQAIAKALDKKIDSTEAVEHYKASLAKESRDAPTTKSSKRETGKVAASRRGDNARGAAEQQDTAGERKTVPVQAEQKSRRPKEQASVRNKEARSSSKSKQTRKTKSVVDRQEPKTPVDPSAANEIEKQKSSIASPRRSTSTRDVRAEVDGAAEASPISQAPADKDLPETENIAAASSGNGEDKVPTSAIEPSGNAVAMENSAEKSASSVPDHSVTVQKDSLRPTSARPASARPAAPKLRWKPDIHGKFNEPALMENEAVIVENFDEHDDNDSMVILEAEKADYSEANDVAEIVNGDNTQEHGYLVAQILETQRELAKENTVDLVSNKIDPEMRPRSKKDTEMIEKEVENLRGTIQSLIRATHPMGKLLDFLQEDVELMEKELSDWRNQYNHFHRQLEMERTESEATAHPLQESFDGIQAGIGEQLEKIYQVKLNIMRNNQKIQQLLLGRA